MALRASAFQRFTAKLRKEDGISNGGYRFLLVLILLGALAVNVILTGVFFNASYRNYPGGESMRWLHLNESPGSVHIDVPSAMTGVSRVFGTRPKMAGSTRRMRIWGKCKVITTILTI